MVLPWEPVTRRNVWDTAGYKRVSHAFEGTCVQEKGDDAFDSRNCTPFSSSVACVELYKSLSSTRE